MIIYDNIYLYLISNLYEKTMASNYYCSETLCEGRIKILYNIESKENTNIIKDIIFMKAHNIKYEDHCYISSGIIKKDLLNESKNNIIKKFKNDKYLHLIL